MNCILHETELAESGGNTSRTSSVWKQNTMVNMWPNSGEHLGFRKGSRFLTSSINNARSYSRRMARAVAEVDILKTTGKSKRAGIESRFFL